MSTYNSHQMFFMTEDLEVYTGIGRHIVLKCWDSKSFTQACFK